ncbi:unnamed protein product [Prunus armeniaca]
MSCKFGPDRTVGSLTITQSDGPSNGPNLANPENTRYAISVRDSNGIQNEIRAHLRAHDNLRITLGQKCPSATVPTRRQRAARARKIGEKIIPHLPESMAGRRRTKPAKFLSKPELFLLVFPAKSRRLAAEPGRGRKRTAARSFWYRAPVDFGGPDESTAGQNVAGCFGRSEPEERERDGRERERE